MKRSRQISLVAMGVAVANLGGCGGPSPTAKAPEVPLFTTVEQCAQSPDYTRKECELGMQFALSQQAQESPRFNDRNSCAASYGNDNCQRYDRRYGGSVWMPLLGGYMLGRLMSGGGRDYHYYNYGGGWSTYTPGGGVRTTRSTPSNLPRPANATIPKPTRAHTAAISRGGFGSRARRTSASS